MAQQKQTVTKPDHKNGHKPAPAVVQQPAGDFAGVAELPGEMVTANGDGIQSQAARLGDGRLQAIQRQKMASQIGKMQGNQHLQRVIQAATRPGNGKAPGNGKSNGNAAPAEGEFGEGELDGLGGGPLAFAGSPPNGNGVQSSNGHIQRENTGNANGASAEESEAPTPEQKAAALAAAKAAKAKAGQAQSNSDQEAGKSQAESSTQKQAKDSAKAKGEAAQAEAKSMAKGGEGGAGASLKPGAATPNGPVNGMANGAIPQGLGGEPDAEQATDKAPASPEEDPGFVATVGKVKAVGTQEKTHEAAKTKADAAQGAAVPPAGEVTSKAQAGQVGAMEATETPAFDKAKFKAKLMEKINASMPKTAQEADDFKDQGKANTIKGELTGEVEQAKETSQGPLEQKTAAAPDASGIEPKPVTPMTAEQAGETPGSIGAEAAAPKEKGKSELEAPLRKQSQATDQQMAEAEVTDEQLANSNEPEFTGAVAAKNEAKTQAKEGPKEYRQFEGEQINKAKTEAEAVAQTKTQAMHTTRAGLFAGVDGQKTETKSADEQKRAEVTAKIQGIYDKTKTKVETLLKTMDKEVNDTFEKGAATAKQSFENYIEAETEAHKQERYGGWLGWARWIKDKFKSDPEIDRIAERGKALFIKEMDAVINNVVEIVARGLTEAKAEISNGKKEIQSYVEKLPSDLKEVGQQAANEVQSKFEELESDVNNKQDELIDSLSAKYKEKLDAVNARVEAIKEANKGLVDRAMDAIGGVIRTILQLKDMLLNVLSRAAEAVGKIIKDPIGFLGNLLSAVKQGFSQFVANIGTHLKKGLIAWLTGSIAGAGITLPETFDLKGIFQLVMQILGISFQQIIGKVSGVLGFDVMGVYDQIMQIVGIYQEEGLVGLAKFGLEKLIGEEGVAALMEVVKIFDVIKSGDLGKLWGIIQEHLTSLKEMVMTKIEEFIAERVVKAGITWLLSLFNPAGAFIKACKMIYDVVMFFVERGSQIMSLVNAIIDSISAIASGSIGSAANFIEQALAKAIPVAISFLSSLLGLGNVSEKVKEIITSVRSTVDKAIDGVLNSKPVQMVAGFIKKAIGKVKGFVKGGVEKVKGKLTGEGKEEKGKAEGQPLDLKQVVNEVSASLKTPSEKDDPAEVLAEKKTQASELKSKYQPQLPEGKTLNIKFDESVTDAEKEGDIDFEVSINPSKKDNVPLKGGPEAIIQPKHLELPRFKFKNSTKKQVRQFHLARGGSRHIFVGKGGSFKSRTKWHRRHVVPWGDMRRHFIEVFVNKKVKDAAAILEKEGQPAKMTLKSVVQTIIELAQNAFNDAQNLFIDLGKENSGLQDVLDDAHPDVLDAKGNAVEAKVDEMVAKFISSHAIGGQTFKLNTKEGVIDWDVTYVDSEDKETTD